MANKLRFDSGSASNVQAVEGEQKMSEFFQVVFVINVVDRTPRDGALTVADVTKKVNEYMSDGWKLFSVENLGIVSIGDLLNAGVRMFYSFVR